MGSSERADGIRLCRYHAGACLGRRSVGNPQGCDSERSFAHAPFCARNLCLSHTIRLQSRHLSRELSWEGGLSIELARDDPWLDYQSIAYESGGRRIDLLDPASSLVFAKPTGATPHQGGQRFEGDSPEAKRLLAWLAEGARWSEGSPYPAQRPSLSEEEPVALWVEPKEAWVVDPNHRLPIVVLAKEADGIVQDVTRWAKLETSAIQGVAIDERGTVHAEAPIDVTISVTYLRQRAASRIVFLDSSGTEKEPHFIAGGTKESTEAGIEATEVDRKIEQRIARMGLSCLPIESEAVWLRRTSLATMGRLPTLEELNDFANDRSPLRKERWIDRLLIDPGHDALWAMAWSDILRNEPKVMSRKGTEQWNAWFREQMSRDVPVDAMIRSLLTTTGSTYEQPPASFHRTHRDPTVAAEGVGQAFLGVRLQCTKCHNHPFDRWKQDDYYGLAAYFANIERKEVDNKRPDDLDKHVITGDEIISVKEGKSALFHPGRYRDVEPSPPVVETFQESQGESEETKGNATPLHALAKWLTRGNRQFARNMANRVWFHLVGRGIVDPPDDFRDSNPPSNPELLEYLTDEFISSGYSIKRLERIVLSSRFFQRQGISQQSEKEGLPLVSVFAGFPIRRLPAEVLLDAVSDATGVPTSFRKGRRDEGENVPDLIIERAVRFAAIPRTAGFLKTFGKPDRLLTCECERSTDSSLTQSLAMLNGPEILPRLLDDHGNVAKWSQRGSSQETRVESIEEAYLTILSRSPTHIELEQMLEHLAKAVDSRKGWEDIVWALLNSKEFSLLR